MFNKKKTILIILAFIFCIPICMIFYLWYGGSGPFFSARHLIFKNSEAAVSDARTIIKTIGSKSIEENDWYLIKPKDLPESLRIPRLRYALAFKDHLSLVASRNPDWEIGARIWTESISRPHKDAPTKYKDIYFYKYCNDYNESPKNIK
jgi:hypothetical protein